MGKRRRAEEKAEIVIASLRGKEPISALCRRHGISEPTLYAWRREFISGGKERLGRQGREQDNHLQEMEELKALVVELTVANRLLKKLSES
jgi:transposase-like protein